MWIEGYGEEEGVRLFVHKRIDALVEGKEMLHLLSGKVRTKGWVVDHLEQLEKVVEVHDALLCVDALLTKVIALTDPATVAAPRPAGDSNRLPELGSASHRRRDDSTGRHVGRSVRIPKLGSASHRRRDDSAGRHVGRSVRIPKLGSASGRRPSVPASSSTPRRRRRGGRRHALPRIIDPDIAQELLEAGNALQAMRLLSIKSLGKAVAGAGLALLRQKKTQAELHELLLEVEEQVGNVWAAEVCLKDL